MPATLWALSIFCLFCTGCYKGNLYVQQEWIDVNFLASTRVGTPDPRQESPVEGQRLLVSWWFPESTSTDSFSLQATIRFWDQTETIRTHPIDCQKGWAAFYFPHDRPDTDCRILTYKVEVLNGCGCVEQVWYHHFWTELIDIDTKSF